MPVGYNWGTDSTNPMYYYAAYGGSPSNPYAGAGGYGGAGGGYGGRSAENYGAGAAWNSLSQIRPSNTARFLPGVGVQIDPRFSHQYQVAQAQQRAMSPYSGGGGGFGGGAGMGSNTSPYPVGVSSPLGGGGGQNPLLGQLFNKTNAAWDQAKAANESRYQDILGQYQDRYSRNMGALGQLSNQELQDANMRYDQNRDRSDQSAISRGLHNTTVTDSLRRGVEQDRSAELRRINDAKTMRQIGLDTGLSKDKLEFMERRTDAYPDLGMMVQLAEKAGAGGYAGGGGGGYGAAAGAAGGGVLSGAGAGGATAAPGGSGGGADGGAGDPANTYRDRTGRLLWNYQHTPVQQWQRDNLARGWSIV